MHPDESRDDAWLRGEFHRSADQVQPADRIAEIRQRLAHDGGTVSDLGARRGLRPVVLAVGAVAATVIAASVLLPRAFTSDPTPAPVASQTLTESPIQLRDPAIPVYYAASDHVTQSAGSAGKLTPLAREFHRDDNSDRMQAALRELSSTPSDPDYRTHVPAGMVRGASKQKGRIVIRLDSPDRSAAPASMTDFDARTAGLQIVYTVRAVVGEGRMPVEFRSAGRPLESVLGVPTRVLDSTVDSMALAPVNLTSPAQGDVVRGDTLTLTGRGWDLGPGSNYVITSAGDAAPLRQGSIAVPDPSPHGFQRFEARVDVADLPAGDYLVSVTSRQGLAELLPDTKQFTIR